jgi:beta-galactosidase
VKNALWTLLVVIGALLCVIPRAFGQTPDTIRQQLLMDFGWKFHLGDASSPEGDFGYGEEASFAKAGEASGAAKPDFNDADWRTIDLPHDWAVEQDFVNVNNDDVKDHGYKPIGRLFPKTTIGWYRKTFTIPLADEQKKLVVKFEGVFRDCIVWLNGQYLTRNMGGYNEFSIDISDYVKFGSKNVLVVRVDASQYEGWFYEGAGIYRHVWLMKTAPLHIPLYGTYVTSDVHDAAAKVDVETKVVNEQNAGAYFKLVSTVVDQEGRAVGFEKSDSVHMAPYEETTLHQTVNIINPFLWSPDSPYVYTLYSNVNAGKNTVDRLETPFGIRTIRFDKDSGLFVNNKPVKIKGVCNHQDHAGVGSALPDELQYFRIRKLKEMGCNAYRTSHNPPMPALLDACDKLGMLVMDENRLLGSTPQMLDQMRGLILRDRNHPSVFIWSLGNEEWQIQNGEIGRKIAESLKRVQRELDPSRLCTYAGNNGAHYDGVNSVVDVRGVNYFNIGDIDQYHSQHPDQPLMGSEEASAFCTRGIYANDTINGYMSDYDVNKPGYGSLAEEWWKHVSTRPWYAGAFVWTGFDYRGEPSPYSWPCINSHFGILDVCGFPKNTFYYYQSWWQDSTVLHLSPHWNWAGKEGKPIDVWCQTNCDSVELSLNDKTIGTKVILKNSHAQWQVPYEVGTLSAKGWRNGRIYTTDVSTTGSPKAIHLSADRDTVHADGEDVCVVTVTALDSLGRENPVADGLVQFEIEGGGKIIGVGNGNPSSHEPDKFLNGGWQRKLFNGKCAVIIQASRQPGVIELKASSNDLKTAELKIFMQRADSRPFLGD